MLLLNRLKKLHLTNKSLNYIKNYQTVYRKVLKEAKRMALEKLVASAINKPKRIWNIIMK
jgi:hypothetical protein